jgi:hypothetical protein
MSQSKRRSVKRHRLLVYHRLGQRMRTLPFLLAIFSIVLLAIGWLGNSGILEGGDQSLLSRLWDQRNWLYVLVGASVLLYLFSVYLSLGSYVEARKKTLRIKAGVVPVDVSYARIRQLRLVQFGMQYPLDKLKGREAALVEPFEGSTCTALDLKSVPKPFTPQLLKQMWSKFMFTATGDSLMLVVKDPMVLNQQIDSQIAARQARLKKESKYLDPIERAAQQQAERAARATKAQKARAAAPQTNLGRKK